MITKQGYKFLGAGLGLALLWNFFGRDASGLPVLKSFGGDDGGCGCGG